MIVIELIYNLSVLVALSVLSGFINAKFIKESLSGKALQGFLFGVTAITGMMNPFVFAEGIIFDGRSIVISLCTLFFGPISGFIAAVMAIFYRIYLGGGGATMGVLVILSSFLTGAVFFYYRCKRFDKKISSLQFYFFGLIVHALMLLLVLALPSKNISAVYQTITVTIIGIYPLVTVLIGKILMDQEQNNSFINTLKESEKLFRTTLYSIGDGVITTDSKGRIVNMNAVAEEITGWNESEAKGILLGEVFKLVNEDSSFPIENPVDRVLRDGHIVGLANHIKLLRKDGKYISIADSGSPIKDDTNKIIGVVLVFRDQTKERSIEKIILESNAKFSKIFNSTSDSISLTKIDTGEIVECNEGFNAMFGFSKEETIGKSTLDLSIWVNPEERNQIVKLLKSNGHVRNFEASGRRKDGKIFTGLVSGEMIDVKNEKLILLNVRDITERKIFEESLKLNEEKYRMLLDFASDAFFQGNQDGDFITVNNKAVDLTGYSKEELLKMNMKDLFSKEVLYTAPLRYDKLMAGETIKIERVIIKKDGKSIYVEMTSKQMPDGTFQSFIRDITENKIVEKEFKASEERFRKAFITSPDAININRLSDGIYVTINNGFTKMTGYTEEEVIGKTSAEIEIWADIKYRNELVEKIKTSTTVDNFEAKFRAKDGIIKDGLMSASVIELNGEPHIISITRDISERKKAENDLLKTKIHYQKMIENAPDGIVQISMDGGFKFVSLSAKRIFGYQLDQRVADHPNDLTHPDDLPSVLLTINKIISDPTFIPTIEYRFKHTNGSWIWIESTFTNLLSEPSVSAIVINFRDISYRKSTEDALKQNEETYRLTAEQTGEVIYDHDMISKNTKWAGAIENVTGFSPEEFLSEVSPDIFRYIHHDDSMQVNEICKGSLISGKNYRVEYRFKHKNGHYIFIEDNAAFIRDSNNKPVRMLGTLTDINNRKLIENQLRNLSRAVEQSPATIVITDIKGNIVYVNPKFKEISGYTYEEVLGKNPRLLGSGEKSAKEYEEMWDTILNGEEWHGEFYNRKKNGELYWESAIISPILDDKGTISNFIAIKEDITKQKKMTEELIEAKEKAEEMNKLKSYFFANMSHELRTPFVGILGFAEILKDRLQNSEEREFAEQILKSSKRLTDTLNKILNVTKLEFDKVDLKYKEFDVCKLLKSTEVFYHSSAKLNNTSISTELKTESIIIKSDRKLLDDILNNLVSNAVKFTHNGDIKLSAHKTSLSGKKFLIIMVKDNGIGIPKEKQELVWQEFRQASEGLNRSFEGTGLGLTITKKYVEILGGKISLESEENKGTIFTIKLPIDLVPNTQLEDAEEIPVQINHVVEKPINRKSKILYVEDDMVALKYINIILRSAYDVETAFNASLALELVQKTKYDALMLDINLGSGMDGVELLQKIRKIEFYKTIPIVAVTAYAAHSDKTEFLAKGFSHYISKPFSKKELFSLLKEMLSN